MKNLAAKDDAKIWVARRSMVEDSAFVTWKATDPGHSG
jgi:hypothetical protein